MSYQRPHIAAMNGYTPGEQPSADNVVKLNTNENPYPPPPPVLKALQAVTADQLRRYPDPLAKRFRQVAANMHGLTPDHIIAVNGGDELLRLVITTFVEPGKPIGMAEPSYSLYPVLAEIHGSPMVRVPLDDEWRLPADYAEKLNDAGVQLAFIVNPHAPSGRLTGVNALKEIAQNFQGVLVIDEAYVNFVDPDLKHDATELVRRCANVILLRSMSKGYSLAGLRFGYGVGDPSLIEPMLTKTKDSYNVDAVAQQVATAALESRGEAAITWQDVRRERARLSQELSLLGLEVAPSQSNFVLAGATDEMNTTAKKLYQALKKRDIFVRYFDQPRLKDKLRITVGTPKENDALLAALRELIA